MSAPTRLGRYPVRRRIGAGAFATVWLAYDEHLDSPVAIKVLADNWTEDLHIRRRFVEEGRFLRKVEAPHVVAVYDAGELDDGRPFLVMSYADQGTLADRLELGGLSAAQALGVLGEIGEGLSALHDRGVLHRDVKPANVLFRSVESSRGSRVVAMLGDLGLGKAMDMSSRLTMVGGTPTYVAPEQARGEGLDPRADQFSLAALAYHLLTGRQPYSHTSLAAAEDPEPPPPIDTGNPETDGAIDAVVRRALAKDREDRYDDVDAFIAALRETVRPCTDSGARDDATLALMPVDPDDLRPPSTEAAANNSAEASTDPDVVVATKAVEVPATPARRVAWVAAAVAALLVGTGAGWAVERASVDTRTIADTTGTLEVTVPEGWTRHVAPEQWSPIEDRADQVSLSAGERADWNSADDPAPGVFVGVVPGDRLPTTVPGHPECGSARSPVRDFKDNDELITVIFEDCPGVPYMIERVIQVNQDQLLWVQIRSRSTKIAAPILDSVKLIGS